MYETYLQNERDWEENIKPICDGFDQLCREKGYKQVEGETYMAVSFKNRLSLIKVMKALEKELEGEEKETSWRTLASIMPANEAMSVANKNEDFNEGLQLSLDKIREFIKEIDIYEQ